MYVHACIAYIQIVRMYMCMYMHALHIYKLCECTCVCTCMHVYKLCECTCVYIHNIHSYDRSISIATESPSSLAVVNCADYPELCKLYTITHYPTVILFRASPNDWSQYRGMLDSRRMLRVVENREEEKEGLVSWRLCV